MSTKQRSPSLIFCRLSSRSRGPGPSGGSQAWSERGVSRSSRFQRPRTPVAWPPEQIQGFQPQRTHGLRPLLGPATDSGGHCASRESLDPQPLGLPRQLTRQCGSLTRATPLLTCSWIHRMTHPKGGAPDLVPAESPHGILFGSLTWLTCWCAHKQSARKRQRTSQIQSQQWSRR